MRKKTIGKFMIALIALSMAGCNKSEDIAPKKELLEPVSLSADSAQVTKRDMSISSIYAGEIVPAIYNLSFDTTGTLGWYCVRTGDMVEQGQELVCMSKDSQVAQLQMLKDSKEQMLNQYEQEQNGLSQQIQQLNEQYNENASNLLKVQSDLLKEQLSLSQQLMKLDEKKMDEKIENAKSAAQNVAITSPIYGRVIALANIDKGAGVGPQTVMITLADDTKQYICSSTLTESELKSAVRYYVILGGKEYTNFTLAEKEETISWKAGSTYLQLEDDDVINTGETATIVLVDEEKKDVLTIPKEAVLNDTLGTYVLLYDGDEKVRTEIETGLEDMYGVEVTSGLKEGDLIYVKNYN